MALIVLGAQRIYPYEMEAPLGLLPWASDGVKEKEEEEMATKKSVEDVLKDAGPDVDLKTAMSEEKDGKQVWTFWAWVNAASDHGVQIEWC